MKGPDPKKIIKKGISSAASERKLAKNSGLYNKTITTSKGPKGTFGNRQKTASYSVSKTGNSTSLKKTNLFGGKKITTNRYDKEDNLIGFDKTRIKRNGFSKTKSWNLK